MFDSGFGGLTVARAAIDLLPAEDLVYLGDTSRYPYGPQPLETVKGYANEIAAYLIDQYDVKVLVVACNTATAAAVDEMQETLPIPVVGVIEPGVRSVLKATRSNRVGVIGTVGTIDSEIYQTYLAASDPGVSVVSCACPGLVEFVERGVTSGREVSLLLQRLLAPIVEANVDALLLGCTHYPYLARAIADVVGREVVLVSSADETAFALAEEMTQLGILRHSGPQKGEHKFISSGDVRSFAELGSRLLGPELHDALLWSPP